MDFEFGFEDIVYLGMGLLGGFLALFVQKSVSVGPFIKIATFVCTTIVGYFVTKFVMNK